MIVDRKLSRDEIEGVWTIDRSEVIDGIYSLVDGALFLNRVHHEVKGWPPGEAEKYTPILQSCLDQGGWDYGLFDDATLISVVVLAGRFMGTDSDQLQLEFLHVSNRYRHRGLGQQLFALAAGEARKRGAKSLYISATPSERTINFYLRLGCVLTPQPDPELFELEPDDIHLEYQLAVD